MPCLGEASGAVGQGAARLRSSVWRCFSVETGRRVFVKRSEDVPA
jgi:hypothetical protein